MQLSQEKPQEIHVHILGRERADLQQVEHNVECILVHSLTTYSLDICPSTAQERIQGFKYVESK